MKAKDLASLVAGRLLGDDVELSGLNSLVDAKPSEFLAIIWPKDVRLAKKSQASCLLLEESIAADHADEFDCSLIVVEEVQKAWEMLAHFFENGEGPSANFTTRSIHEQAFVHESAIIGLASIGAHTRIGPFAVVHDNVIIGEHCSIGAHTVIGSEGFVPSGYAPSKLLKSLGQVEIGDHVRIGAHCTIDRGLLGATRVGSHTLIDNMVHIGHDVNLGQNVVIAAQTGLAGLVRIADHVTLGGQVGVKPQVFIDEGARISAKSMVHCDIKKYEIWSGNPSLPHAGYLRAYAETKRKFRKSSERPNN